MNFYNHHIRSIFKSHSIIVTFKICAVLGAQGIRATGFKRAQGNAHCAKFESNTNRMNFEYSPNMVIVKVHPQGPTLKCGFVEFPIWSFYYYYWHFQSRTKSLYFCYVNFENEYVKV